MMKKFLVFLLVLAVVAGVGYVWWQRHSSRIIAGQVRQIAGRFFTNPQQLIIEHSAVKMTGFRTAKVASLTISGKGLQPKDGPELSMAKLSLKHLEVTGPPFRLSKVGSGAFEVTVTDSAVTEYLHTRKGSVAGVHAIPLNTLSVQFQAAAQATARLNGSVKVPVIDKRVPFSVTGNLVPSSEAGQLDFRPGGISIPKLRESLRIVNPLVDLSGWPVSVEINSVKTTDGKATVRGAVTGADDSLLRRF